MAARLRKVVAVFGSSAPRAGEPDYEQARDVGRLLAEHGFAVMSGGYGGTMAAVSQGAAEAGGHVIGVACDQIEAFRGTQPNPWLHEIVRYRTLQERLLHLVTENDGMLCLPGGIGTLSEMTLAWSLLQVGELPQRPFALLGTMWPQFIAATKDPKYMKQQYIDLLYFAQSPAAAVAHMNSRHHE